LGLQQKAIGAAAEETLEGHQRSILGFNFIYIFFF